MLENQIGKRYAEALSGSIGDDSQLGVALKNLQDFGELLKTENQLVRFFEHPSISTDKKRNVVEDLCSRLQIGEKIGSLLLLLNDRGKIIFLEKIIYMMFKFIP